MTSLKIGVVGAAGGQARTWLRRLSKWKNVKGADLKIEALCDINEAGLKKVAETYKAKYYTDYNEMFDKHELDIALIVTPHFLHAPMTIAAAEHGFNVLTEKPMCINLKQADEMITAVDKAGVKAAVGFQHRFNPIYVALKRVVDSGDLGDVFQINMIYHWWRTEDYYLNSTPVPENEDEDWEGWRGHWKTEGAGSIANQIVHFIDIFQWISPSPIKRLFASSRVAKHTFVEVEDNTNAIVEFENDSMGLMQSGVAYQYGKQEDIAVYGTEGAIMRRLDVKGPLGIPKMFKDMRKPSVKKQHPIRKYLGKLGDTSKMMFENFVESILNDDPSIISVDLREGRKTIEIMRAINLSNKYGKKIEFPFEDEPDEFPDLPHTYVDPRFKDMV